MIRAGGVGVSAGVIGTWLEMSHGVVCIPVVTIPPLALTHQVAVGSTVFGVAARQMISAFLYGVAPENDISDFETLERLIDVPSAAVLGVSSTVTALSAAAFASKLRSSSLRRCSGALCFGLGLFLQWRDKNMRKADPEDLEVADWELPYKQQLAEGAKGGAMAVDTPTDVEAVPQRSDVPRLIALGAAAGGCLGFFGIGPAWLLAPVLSASARPGQLGFTTDKGSEQDSGAFCSDERTRTTACLAMVPSSLAAAARHWHLGNVTTTVAVPLAVGAVAGSAWSGQNLSDVPCDWEVRFGISCLLMVYGCWAVVKQT